MKSFHTELKFDSKIHSSISMDEMTNSIAHNQSTCLLALIQSVNRLSNFERIAQPFVNLNEFPKTAKQSTPSRVRFDDETKKFATQTKKHRPQQFTKTHKTPQTSVDINPDAFNLSLSKIFRKMLLACLTTKDAILNVVRDCVLTGNEERCKPLRSPYIHRFWQELHAKSGCVCIDDRIAIQQFFQKRLLRCNPQNILRQLGDDGYCLS